MTGQAVRDRAWDEMLYRGLTAARISLQIHCTVLIAGDDLGLQKGMTVITVILHNTDTKKPPKLRMLPCIGRLFPIFPTQSLVMFRGIIEIFVSSSLSLAFPLLSRQFVGSSGLHPCGRWHRTILVKPFPFSLFP